MFFESYDPFRIALYRVIGEVPWYHLVLEVFLVIWIVGLLFKKSYRPSDVAELTEKEKEELIAEWSPEPLVPDVDPEDPRLQPIFIEGKVGKFVMIDQRPHLNFASLNFLDFIGNQKIEDMAVAALHKYGVGSCGPRGFYGTMDVHIELEKKIANYLHCEESVLYSYGFPTIASVIPAYAKRGDVIFCDKGVNFAILKGLQASRSRVEFFEHNDMQDLEQLLQLQAVKDRLNPKKARVTRRFLVVEGIYFNYGTICPLPKLVELKWKYQLRLFIDESVSFGVLGEHGRGVTEYFGVNVDDVDLICASLENAAAGMGGFSCGRTFVCDHQRLSGAAYCFSASLPPLLAASAIAALEIMEFEPERFEKLRRNSIRFEQGLQGLKSFTYSGVAGSPIFHLRCGKPPAKDQGGILDRIVAEAREKKIILTKAAYLRDQELFVPPQSIRISLGCQFDDEDIDRLLEFLGSVSYGVHDVV